ncbi:MAG: hypothetical protein U0941_26070 [Planctomycetaceae bacterium]
MSLLQFCGNRQQMMAKIINWAALFAEMVKKPWIPPRWRSQQRYDGIGINFLEETFVRSANPATVYIKLRPVRYSSIAAREWEPTSRATCDRNGVLESVRLCQCVRILMI